MAKKKMKTSKTAYLIIALICLVLCEVLPIFTEKIPQFGTGLRPMHFPVLIAGFACGPWLALIVGATAPIIIALMHGAPMLIPTEIAMSFELATYGVMAGLLYSQLPRKTGNIYVSLITAMIVGRIVWCASMLVIAGRMQTQFTYHMFIAYAFVDAVPGIIVQIVLIPAIVIILEKANLTYRGRK